MRKKLCIVSSCGLGLPMALSSIQVRRTAVAVRFGTRPLRTSSLPSSREVIAYVQHHGIDTTPKPRAVGWRSAGPLDFDSDLDSRAWRALSALCAYRRDRLRSLFSNCNFPRLSRGRCCGSRLVCGCSGCRDLEENHLRCHTHFGCRAFRQWGPFRRLESRDPLRSFASPGIENLDPAHAPPEFG